MLPISAFCFLTSAFRTGAVAQLGEHLLCKQGVVGSIPISSTKLAVLKQFEVEMSRSTAGRNDVLSFPVVCHPRRITRSRERLR